MDSGELLRQQTRSGLMALRDTGYRDFIARLIPTIDKARIIGVRAPALKRLAKAFPEDRLRDYLRSPLPHDYFEEMGLHGALIGRLKDYDEALDRTRAFLPHVDNWATCDSFVPTALRKRPEAFYDELKGWLRSDHVYTIRFGIVNLMGDYLGKHFEPEMLALVSAIRSETYYVNMAIAWYLSEALLKQPALTLPLLEDGRLSPFVHRMAIQKAVESHQISPELKQTLRGLRKPRSTSV